MQHTVITRTTDGTLVLTPRCEHFDSEFAADFLRQAESALDTPDGGERYELLVIDLESVRLIDSYGLGAISRCARMISSGEAGVTLCNASPEVRVALSLSQLDKSMTVSDACGNDATDVRE